MSDVSGTTPQPDPSRQQPAPREQHPEGPRDGLIQQLPPSPRPDPGQHHVRTAPPAPPAAHGG
ncbi:hypothetical protein ABZ371_24605, partial [Streptomyces sp. NPDC005899]